MEQKKSKEISGNRKETANKLLLDRCRETPEEALAQMGSRPEGLSDEEHETRLKKHGANIMSSGKKTAWFMDIILRFRDPLVIQLLIIGGLSYFMGDRDSAWIVGGILMISIFLAYFQERRSSTAAKKLQQLVQTSTHVLRTGKELEVRMEDVVPGDIVNLNAGSIIPADVRILSCKDFFVNQSAFTGESMPVEKFPTLQPAFDGDALSCLNACFQGSSVFSGSAKAVTVNTASQTYLGGISQDLSETKTSTGFDKGVLSFVTLMFRFMLIMVSLTFMIVGLTKHNWIEALLFGLSVAVGLTPAMLPMIMTVCLSKGAIAMSKKKVIIKKLKAIQNFGAMNVLCTDKTGTLTQDNIILEKYVDVTNRESDDVLRYAYMNSYYQTGLRNLMDRAILAHSDLEVEKTCLKVDEIPFDFSRKRMSVVIEYQGRHVLICKGSVEEVYNACDKYQIDEEINPLISVIKDDLHEEFQRLSADGYRVLAIAYREFDRTEKTFSVADEAEMILLGYVAFFDPPKDSAASALAALERSGIAVKILTGDNGLVTKKVCHDVGFAVEQVILGKQLATMTKEEFQQTVHKEKVFAGLTPSQKEEIIMTLREQGSVVGFLGDGINDAPAMKAADVGISVDTAVDIAKESADIILLEKNLNILEEGILEGRRIFANIIKYIKMSASSNFGNMFSVIGGSYFLPFLPMTPVQILLNNLLYDVSQTGIPSDNVDEESTRKPHKWNIKSIRRFMLFIGPVSSLFDYATFFLMLYFFKCILFASAGATDASKIFSESLFHSGWFVESLLTQTLIVHIIRTNKIPFIQSRASLLMTLTTLSVMAIGIYLPYSPFASFFGLVPLPAIYWGWIILFLCSYVILTHLVKTWLNKKFGVEQ